MCYPKRGHPRATANVCLPLSLADLRKTNSLPRRFSNTSSTITDDAQQQQALAPEDGQNQQSITSNIRVPLDHEESVEMEVTSTIDDHRVAAAAEQAPNNNRLSPYLYEQNVSDCSGWDDTATASFRYSANSSISTSDRRPMLQRRDHSSFNFCQSDDASLCENPTHVVSRDDSPINISTPATVVSAEKEEEILNYSSAAGANACAFMDDAKCTVSFNNSLHLSSTCNDEQQPSRAQRQVSEQTESAIEFINQMDEVTDVIECMQSIPDKAGLAEEGLRWLLKKAETPAGARDILKSDTAIATCLDTTDTHKDNINVIIPALQLLHRLVLFSIEQEDYSRHFRHYSLQRGVHVNTAIFTMEFGGLFLCRAMIKKNVKNLELMKLVCEIMWTFCIAGGEDERLVASSFVDEGLVPVLQYLLEEQADFEVLANVADIIYYIIQFSDVGKRQLVDNKGVDALTNARFICESDRVLRSSLSKVLQLLS